MLLVVPLLLLFLQVTHGQQQLLVSGYSKEIDIYQVGKLPSNHSLSKDSAWLVDANLTWIQLPSSGWLGPGNDLYAIHEVSSYSPGQNTSSKNSIVHGGAVSRWTYDQGHLNRQEWVSVGRGPAHLLVDLRPQYGGFAYTANYGDGTWSAVRVDLETGKLGFEEYRIFFNDSETCHHGSHPHNTVVWGPNIWVVDLGCDIIHHLRWKDGLLGVHNSTKVASGHGPRHMEIHPWRNIAFVVCELQNFLEVYRFDELYGNMTKLQEIALTSQKSNAGAEIVLVERGLDLDIYVSSRGVGMIEFFTMKGTEHLVTKEQEFLLQGTWPRHMTLHPSGSLLAVGDQKGNNVELVNIDIKTGNLSAGTIIQPGDGPMQPSFLAFFQTWSL